MSSNRPIKILFDSYHLYHLPQFDPVIDLLSHDDRFDIFHSTCSDNKKIELDLCLPVLESKPGTLVFAETEEERMEKIRALDLHESSPESAHLIVHKTYMINIYFLHN